MLIIITENPSITIDKLSKDIGCSIRTIKNVLKVLETNKKIKESMANVMAVGKFINNDLKKETTPFSL
ncbi:MAG: HTH domain-containing protein [Bacilli bacterium]|nr:HTH domain-containing protein [Bacilli bacterium]